jgi:hypothetical protein
MDLIADQYDANDSALRRTVDCIKDALDPAGILAPGKQGIWPAAADRAHMAPTYRPQKSPHGRTPTVCDLG